MSPIIEKYPDTDALVAAAAVGDGSPAVVLTWHPGDLERLLQHDRHVGVRTV
jgi:hypothetical protein